MTTVQDALDRYAADVPYGRLTASFLEFERVPGDDPVLLLAEAAAAATGQNYVTGVRPTVERFADAFVATDRVTSVSDLAAIDLEDPELIEAVGAQRKRRVLLEAAAVLAARPEGDDLEALRAWAAEADVYAYEDDPIGAISGVGPSTFQYLRMLAGVDTAKPDPGLIELLEAVAEAADEPTLATTDRLRAVAACEWLAIVTSYRRLEIDRIAWWTFTEAAERERVVADTL